MRAAVLGVILGGAMITGVAVPSAGASDPPADSIANSTLRELAAGSAGVTAELGGQSVADGRVTIEVLSGLPEADVRAIVADHGGVVSGAVPGHLVQVDIPVDELAALGAVDGIDYLRPPLAVGLPEAGAPQPGDAAADLLTQTFTGSHVSKTNVDDWQAQGYAGQGVKIGVIDSFDGAVWQAAVEAGEVPQPRGTLCLTLGLTCDIWNAGIFKDDHGIAVSEVIHDQAPDAELYLATVYTASDLQAAVDWFAANGVTVINRSQTAEYDGPGDGTGPTATVVDSAVAKGIVWMNSAGNTSGTTGDTGEYYRSEWRDGDGDGYHDFSPGAGEDEVFRALCNFTNGVRWSDWGSVNPTDYDVEIYADEAATTLLGKSEDRQGGGAPPLELLNFKLIGKCALGVDYVYVKLHRFAEGDGSTGDTIEFMANRSRFEYWQNPYGASGPMVDSANPGLLAVGAVDPAAGTTIASYSSWGPTNDGRMKPDMSAASCVITWTTEPGCFNGTSAASPTTAGAAAVVRSSGLHTTPAAIANFLRSSVVDRGDVGPDNVYGTGELLLPAPPVAATPAGEVHMVTPTRILDTRKAVGVPGTSPVGPKGGIDVTVLGVGGVPASGVDSVVVNLTGVGPSAAPYLTAYPSGAPKPNASSLNLELGETAANLVTVKVGAGGKVRIYNSSGATHVVADVVAWIDDGSASGGTVHPLASARIMDSRSGLGVDDAPVVAGAPVRLQVAGVGGVPASGVDAVFLNLTATGVTTDTHVTAYGSTGLTPYSNLNVSAGATRPNMVLVHLDPGGGVWFANKAGSTDLIADVFAYVDDGAGTGSQVVTQSPARIIDTRWSMGDRRLMAVAPFGTSTAYAVGGHGGVPVGQASAVLLNVTVTGATEATHVSLTPEFPSVATSTSNLNVLPGQTRANLVVVPLSADGLVITNRRGDVDVIVDVVGWLA